MVASKMRTFHADTNLYFSTATPIISAHKSLKCGPADNNNEDISSTDVTYDIRHNHRGSLKSWRRGRGESVSQGEGEEDLKNSKRERIHSVPSYKERGIGT